MEKHEQIVSTRSVKIKSTPSPVPGTILCSIGQIKTDER